MRGIRSNKVSGASIDQTLSQINAAISHFEECLDRVRYEDAQSQGAIIAQLTKSLPTVSKHVTKPHKEWLASSLERLKGAISRFDVATKPAKKNTARDAYSRYN